MTNNVTMLTEDALKDAGLSTNEAKVFLALLELGPSSVGNIAKTSKIHRTNVYDSLKKLAEKGLVSSEGGDNTTVFEITNPEKLLELLQEKENQLNEVLPQLELDYNLAKDKTKAHIFEGAKALRDILDGFLKYNEPILTFGIPKNAPAILGDWLEPHHKRRVAKKIDMLHIYNEDAQDRIKYLNKMAHTKARYLPKEMNSPVSTEICGDEIMFVLWQDTPIIIHINNPEIAGYYKKYFYMLWEMAKE